MVRRKVVRGRARARERRDIILNVEAVSGTGRDMQVDGKSCRILKQQCDGMICSFHSYMVVQASRRHVKSLFRGPKKQFHSTPVQSADHSLPKVQAHPWNHNCPSFKRKSQGKMSAAAAPEGQKKQKPSALRSIIAGSTAGAVEIAITYPAEFAKTRTQLNRRLAEGKKLPWPRFGPEWYAGCTTLIIGNSLKAGIRFVAYDAYKNMLSNEDGSISGPATVIAGFGAGVTESLLAVTPFESIKTQLIDDRKSPNPRYGGFLHGSRLIAQEKGIRGFFQGFVPTTARQAANSAVRFSSYTSLRQLAQSYVAPGEKLGAISTFGIGGMAGIITV